MVHCPETIAGNEKQGDVNCLPLKYVFPFPLVIAKLIGDYFDNMQRAGNRTCNLLCAKILGSWVARLSS